MCKQETSATLMIDDLARVSEHPNHDEVFRGFVDLFVIGHREGLQILKTHSSQYPASGSERDEAISYTTISYAMRAITEALVSDGLEICWNGVRLDEEKTKYSGLFQTLQERVQERLDWSEVQTWAPIDKTPETKTKE